VTKSLLLRATNIDHDSLYFQDAHHHLLAGVYIGTNLRRVFFKVGFGKQSLKYSKIFAVEGKEKDVLFIALTV
jgi:hypothetical protein